MRMLPIDPDEPDAETLKEAAEALRSGRLVVFPTETVYGLGADATDERAVGRVFEAKGRPPDNPLIVHVLDGEDARRVTRDVPDDAKRLMEAFWPGPLTLVLPADPRLPRIVTAGLDTVAVRAPAHPVARALLAAAGVPLAAPSANRSGMPSPTRAEHVAMDYRGHESVIALLLDAGPCTIGVESTVVDLTSDPPTVLRLGGVPPEAIQTHLPRLKVDPHARGVAVAPGTSVASPGMKHRHYAPRTPVTLFEGEDGPAKILEAHKSSLRREKKSGFIVSTQTAHQGSLQGDNIVVLGGRNEQGRWAHDLFDALRRLDEQGLDRIFVEGIPETGLGAAVMDRLRRAAARID